jgi:high-affinity Fe2+/Pb2+ permease
MLKGLIDLSDAVLIALISGVFSVLVALISKPQSKATKSDQVEKLLNENQQLKEKLNKKEVDKK